MDSSFTLIRIMRILDSGETVPHISTSVLLRLCYHHTGLCANFTVNGNKCFDFSITKSTEGCRVGRTCYIFSLLSNTFMLVFSSSPDCQRFDNYISRFKSEQAISIFSERTEEASATQYFQFYGYLAQQQNMMQDYIRTGTYQRAILSNSVDFNGKVVLDVGAGSGILSFFAAHAGARKVYAVEASSISEHAKTLVTANRLDHVIEVIAGKIEEIELSESVDMIISEPMGYMLYNERMLETYIHARKWLKPTGKMFPGRGDLHIAPFQDEPLYMEQFSKANFWHQEYFHGVNLSCLQTKALEEYFRQPIVDTFDIRICLAKSVQHVLDFTQASESDLHLIEIPVEFHMLETGTVHGLAFWFDVAFLGSQHIVWLSTAPTEALTHWYQVRCLLPQPLPAKQGQLLTGYVILSANQRLSYDVTIQLTIEGTHMHSCVALDLKNPYFRYTGTVPQPPPGHNTVSPSEQYWLQMDTQTAKQAVNMLNGMSVNGIGEVEMDTSSSVHIVNNQLVNQAAIHPGSIPSISTKQPLCSAPSAVSDNQIADDRSNTDHAYQLDESLLVIGDYLNNNCSNNSSTGSLAEDPSSMNVCFNQMSAK